MSPERTTGPRLLVQWHGDKDCTEVLLVGAESQITHIADVSPDDAEHVLDRLRTSYPLLPVEVKPGAIRIEPTFRVVRFYEDPDQPTETVATGLSLEAARAHCKNPETSWRTATSEEARELTAQLGPWFDGYEHEHDDTTTSEE